MADKMTNVKALSYVLDNFDLPAEVRTKIENIKAQTIKRNSADKKPTKEQKLNETIKADILTALADGTAHTVTEIMGITPSLAGASNQKASALVNQLRNEGKLVREEYKRKAYFKIA